MYSIPAHFIYSIGAQISTCSQSDPEISRRWTDYGTVEVTCKTNAGSLDGIFYGWQLCLQEGGGDCCQVRGESNLTQCPAGEVTPLSKQDGNFTASIQIQVQKFTVQCWVDLSEGRVSSNSTVVDVRDSPFLPPTQGSLCMCNVYMDIGTRGAIHAGALPPSL